MVGLCAANAVTAEVLGLSRALIGTVDCLAPPLWSGEDVVLKICHGISFFVLFDYRK
jgi:hypothetical protein